MNTSRLQYLFEKYFDKTATAEERTELASLISIESNKDQVMELFSAAWEKYSGDGTIVSAEKTSLSTSGRRGEVKASKVRTIKRRFKMGTGNFY